LPPEYCRRHFTELAASELLSRVREFVSDLLAGDIAVELRMVLPNGLSTTQQANLAKAAGAIDEITCSTIHGFCQRLIKPYPSELISIQALELLTAPKEISPSSK